MPTLVIGLLSDTHVPHRLKQIPQAVLDVMTGVDLILHAGDVDDPRALVPLRAIAPVHAVRGNIHLQDLSDGGAALPAVVELELAGKRVVLVHGHWPGPLGILVKGVCVLTHWLRLTDNGDLNRLAVRRLARMYPEVDVIVFGHAHRAHVAWVGDTLLVNPGAVCRSRREQRTVARMRLGRGKPEVEIISLSVECEG
jgi:putative phosphoesterase